MCAEVVPSKAASPPKEAAMEVGAKVGHAKAASLRQETAPTCAASTAAARATPGVTAKSQRSREKRDLALTAASRDTSAVTADSLRHSRLMGGEQQQAGRHFNRDGGQEARACEAEAPNLRDPHWARGRPILDAEGF